MNVTIRMVALAICSLSSVAHAEGGCPSGSFPQQGNGWSACIPAGASRATPPPALQPQWIDRWGALAATERGQIRAGTRDHASESDAVAEAIAICEENSSQRCRSMGAYRNQCVSVASGATGSRVEVGETERNAIDRSMNACKADLIEDCHVYYSACSLPEHAQ